MRTKTIHFAGALLLSAFILAHLVNHLFALAGAEQHIAIMQKLRSWYRQPVAEGLLLLTVTSQMCSGWRLFRQRRLLAGGFFEQLQLWSGIYLAFFLLIHLMTIGIGRWLLGLDTNFYFGVAGLNTFPVNLFFVPYYGLAILAFFGHLAAIHAAKMKRHLLGLSPTAQAAALLLFGLLLAIVVLFGLTNQFQGVILPSEYQLFTPQ